MILLSFFATSAALAAAYECPFKDALVATVLGTPKDLRAQIDYDIPRKEREIVIFPDRKIPGIVALPASLAEQRRLTAGVGINVRP